MLQSKCKPNRILVQQNDQLNLFWMSMDMFSLNMEENGSDLDEHGPVFLKHGVTSQLLALSDIFSLKDGYVTPVLKAANPPVRANVLYLSTDFSVQILSQAIHACMWYEFVGWERATFFMKLGYCWFKKTLKAVY